MTMNKRLEKDIETFLLAADRWVTSREICEAFDLPDDRVLRGVRNNPGLCTRFAISGNQGYKHIALATTTEWHHYYAREREHNIRALVNLRDKRRRRRQMTRAVKRPATIFEKDSGQALLLAPEVTKGGPRWHRNW